DGIIQDWQYWGNNYLWNAMDFLNPNFHNPQRMIDEVHQLNAHIIISIWNSFGPQTKQYRELEKMNALFDMTTWPLYGPERHPINQEYPSGVKVYDPYNPKARELYWRYLDKGLFSLGMDGFWIDSSEPDHFNFKPSDFDQQTYLGSFRKVRNAFPLMTVGGVAQQQRAKSSEKRVFILTRSAFAGQQRYGANLWSGDVVASWQALHAQITAGLNVSLSGIPHWNSDIGGFFLWNFRNPLKHPDYRELHVRWMQFGCFCPMMRSHGEGSPREIYQFGQKGNPVYDALEKYIQLRYRLLPYIYSASYQVSAGQSSMMRALMMDFPQDPAVLDLNSEYMFGKALLVCPVTEPMYTAYVPGGRDSVLKEDLSKLKTKEVYLPAGTDWYDFWTGDKRSGGNRVSKEVPLDIMPLYVRAGSILPWGPKVQYATEQNWDQLEIRVYPGADGEFVLYEDEFDNYNYEKGAYSTISFRWNDKQKTLTIGARQGDFPGMLMNRSFRIIFVEGSKGSGPDSGEYYDQEVKYSGKKVVIRKR
ncbi:MAG: TIM-barrel domain-containing protein, partial [Bacteroidales bacterium]